MNILILMGVYPNYGGVEKVSTILANKFLNLGYGVSIISFEQPFPELASELNIGVNLYQFPESGKFSRKNIEFLRQILIKNNIEVIINQWCLPYPITYLCNQAMKGTNCKRLYAAHHNMPDNNSLIQKYSMLLDENKNINNKVMLGLSKFLTGLSIKLVYNNSTNYILLSNSFKINFKKITKLKKIDKIRVITNPLTTVENNTIESLEKENIILYVGRVDYNQKRLLRLLDVWNFIYKKIPNWKFVIVGDGPDLADLKEKAKSMELERIFFEGFQSPEIYYKKSKILVMSSEYEGFGLVICEGMNYGVVPVVYNSFEAARDIIDDGVNGYLISPVGGKFNAKNMANTILKLVNSNLDEISNAAFLKSKKYNLDTISKEWINLFNEGH